MSRPLTGFRLEFRIGNREFSIGTMVRTTKLEDDESTSVHQVGNSHSIQGVPEPPRPVGFTQ